MVHWTPPAILSCHQGNDGTFEPLRQEAVTSLREFGREASNHMLWAVSECIPPRAPLSRAFFMLRHEIAPHTVSRPAVQPAGFVDPVLPPSSSWRCGDGSPSSIGEPIAKPKRICYGALGYL
jgi:hypothetical protein